jgi:hypothetical protein
VERGPIVSANAWHCIEVEFAGDASYNSLYAWADGTLVHSIAAATDWQNGAGADDLDERDVRGRQVPAGRASAARPATSGWTTSR